MTRIGILNCFDDGNRGSAALNIAAIRAANRMFPDSEVGLVAINDFDPESRRYGYRHTLEEYPRARIFGPLLHEKSISGGRISSIPLEVSSLALRGTPLINRETAEFIDSCDLVISRGGVIYASPPHKTAGLLRRTSAMRYAHARGIPAMHLGLHVMPVRGFLAQSTVSKDFNTSQLLLPRGPISQYWAKTYAPESRSLRMPDSVFSLYLSPHQTRASFEPGHWAVSLTNGAEAAMIQVAALLKQGISEGRVHRVSLVIQVTGGDADTAIANKFMAQIGGMVDVDLVDDDLSPWELIGVYAQTEVVVATRLHAAIFALLGGVPGLVVPVGVRGKDLDVFSEVGLSEFVLDHPTHQQRWAKLLECLDPRVREWSQERVGRAADRHSQALDYAAEHLLARG